MDLASCVVHLFIDLQASVGLSGSTSAARRSARSTARVGTRAALLQATAPRAAATITVACKFAGGIQVNSGSLGQLG